MSEGVVMFLAFGPFIIAMWALLAWGVLYAWRRHIQPLLKNRKD